MNCSMRDLCQFIETHNAINDKSKLSELVADYFTLVKDRSVYYSSNFAIRFSSSSNRKFSNTVLSLSNLQKVDDRPFMVCLVTPKHNYLILANTTFLKKISHSSQQLRENNIRGSFNGSDIKSDFNAIANVPKNFDRLYNIHASIGFEGNLARLVESTNNISPSGSKFKPSAAETKIILSSPSRANRFINSKDALTLKHELDTMVGQYKNEIVIAGLIENQNIRGRIIEYLIVGEDKRLKQAIKDALISNTNDIPPFKTKNALGDFTKEFENFCTETDVKTKIMILRSNPKAYNLDKMLEFLAKEKSVFMFYFVGIDPTRIVNTVLVSMFQKKLLDSTILLKHWAGRNSRGVSQFEGKVVGELIRSAKPSINEDKSSKFLQKILAI
jgi:hypothetical protein